MISPDLPAIDWIFEVGTIDVLPTILLALAASCADRKTERGSMTANG